MADIEKRLKALEKRARVDDERWQKLDGHMKGFSLIIDAIGAPICEATPSVLPAIIANLQNFENHARVQNKHDATIRQLRHARVFFEARVVKGGKGVPPSATGDIPRQKK
jgi:hypothetical protein